MKAVAFQLVTNGSDDDVQIYELTLVAADLSEPGRIDPSLTLVINYPQMKVDARNMGRVAYHLEQTVEYDDSLVEYVELDEVADHVNEFLRTHVAEDEPITTISTNLIWLATNLRFIPGLSFYYGHTFDPVALLVEPEDTHIGPNYLDRIPEIPEDDTVPVTLADARATVEIVRDYVWRDQ